MSALCVTFFTTAALADADGWQAIDAAQPGATVIVNDPPIHQLTLTPTEVAGRWVRAAARFSGVPGDTRITVVASIGARRVSFSTPSECREHPGARDCEAFAWVPRGTDQVKVTLWTASVPATISDLRIERGIGLRSNPAAVARLDDLLSSMARMYYRSADVDWAEVRRLVEPAMAAPIGMDPVPGAIRSAITLLPGNKHTGLYPNILASEQTEESAAMPSCREVTRGVRLLTVPSTYMLKAKVARRYVETANRCLLSAPVRTKWIIDLRDSSGGDSNIMLAALAPVFDAGRLFEWENGAGEHIDVGIDRFGIKTGGLFTYKHPLPIGSRSGTPILVWIGPGCASACEVLAAALSARPQSRLVGKSTAGFATGNEPIEVSPAYTMQLTSGRVRLRGMLLDQDRLFPTNSTESADARDIAAFFDKP